MLLLTSFEKKKIIFEGVRPKPKSSFWKFSKNSFRNELHAPFTLFWYIFLSKGQKRRGGGPVFIGLSIWYNSLINSDNYRQVKYFIVSGLIQFRALNRKVKCISDCWLQLQKKYPNWEGRLEHLYDSVIHWLIYSL